MSRWRIKKVGHPEGVDKTSYRYYVQSKASWWPFWITHYGRDNYEEARNRMKDYISIAERKTTVQHIYHTEAVPDHLPKEQIDQFHTEKNKQAEGKECQT